MPETVDDRTLERVLADIGARLDHTAPSRLRDGVAARIAERRRAQDARGRRSRLLPAAVTLLLLVAVVALASPQVRAAAQEIFHLRGLDIFRVPALPSATPAATRSGLFEGERVSLEEARRRVDFGLLVPSALGAPDEVYLSGIPRDRRVTLVYFAAAGRPASTIPGISTVIVELRADIDRTLLGKVVGAGTMVDEVTVNGGAGYWLSGQAHFFFYRAPSGDIRQETIRGAGNTLVWEQPPLTVRIEAQVTLAEALRIARSMR